MWNSLFIISLIVFSIQSAHATTFATSAESIASGLDTINLAEREPNESVASASLDIAAVDDAPTAGSSNDLKKELAQAGPQLLLTSSKDLNSLTHNDVLSIKFIAPTDANLMLDTLRIVIGGIDKTFSVRLISKVDASGISTPLTRVPSGTKEVLVSIRDSKNREAVFKAIVTVKA